MKSSDNRIHYEEITESNILEATRVEMEIFPDSCGYLSYLKAYEKGAPYFLAYLHTEVIGITGLYTEERLGEANTVWLGWYGLLQKYRKSGLGRTILSDTVEEAKRRGYDTFRLYTSALVCPDACRLYDKFMDVGEDYTLEEPELLRRVYSKSLTDGEVRLWNNRYLFLSENHGEEEAALSLYLSKLEKSK